MAGRPPNATRPAPREAAVSERPLATILTAGSGTRLRPLTPALPKALVPLMNRPLIAYALELGAGLGLAEAVIIVGGDHRGVAEGARKLAPPGLAVSIAEQSQPRGSGDALAAAGEALTGRRVVVIAVDMLIRGDLRPALAAFEHSGALAGLLLHPTQRPTEMGIAVLDGERVIHLEEKPQRPRSDLAVVGVWMLAPEAVERVRTRPTINAKGELDLTSTVASLVAEGGDVRGWRLDGEWLDAGSTGALLSAQSRLLTELTPAPPRASESALSGVVAAGDGARVTGSTLAGPVLLGGGAVIEDCELGPDVVVGDGAQLRSVRLTRALVAPGARLEHADRSDVVVAASGEIGSVVAASR